MIDWHDFVPVEKIEFTAEDDTLPLAAPIDTTTGTVGGEPVVLDKELQEVRSPHQYFIDLGLQYLVHGFFASSILCPRL